MKFFWYLLFSMQPWVMLLALFGLFGKEAEEAAEEFGLAMGVMLLVILVVVALAFGGHALGLW